jgi:hypothetical protein
MTNSMKRKRRFTPDVRLKIAMAAYGSHIGKKFGLLLVLSLIIPDEGHGQTRYLCRCDCGNEKSFVAYSITSKRGSRSCGCREAGRSTKTHGLSASPTYACWSHMKQRILNPRCARYPLYGGRGLTICDRWRDSFANFLADMGEKPDGLCLERIDNNKGYFPGNCKWATQKEQVRNTRVTTFINFRGEIKATTEWAEIYRIHPRTLRQRIVVGWAVEKALTAPVQRRRL